MRDAGVGIRARYANDMMVDLRNRVVPPRPPWMTPQNTPGCQITALYGTIFLQRNQRIVGAGRCEAALCSEIRAKHILIRAYQSI